MTNFTSDSPAPWADQADQITNVEVEGTVTSIGAHRWRGYSDAVMRMSEANVEACLLYTSRCV